MKKEECEEVVEFVRGVKKVLKATFIIGLPTLVLGVGYYITPKEHINFNIGVYMGFMWWVLLLIIYHTTRDE